MFVFYILNYIYRTNMMLACSKSFTYNPAITQLRTKNAPVCPRGHCTQLRGGKLLPFCRALCGGARIQRYALNYDTN